MKKSLLAYKYKQKQKWREHQKLCKRETGNFKLAMERARDQWQWKVQYARYFTFPSYYQSITTTSSPSRLSPFKRNQFRPIWLPSSGISTVSIHPSSDVSSSVDSVLSVSLQGTIIVCLFISLK